MILTKFVNMKWTPKNKEYYISKGYKYTKQFDIFEVKVDDLPDGSNALIVVQCDFCGEPVNRKYQTHKNSIKNDIVNLDCCKNCVGKKHKMIMQIKYGVDNISQLEVVKQKKIETSINNFGVPHPLQNKEVMERVKKTNIEKYGVSSALELPEVKKKAQDACFEKYGTTNFITNRELVEQSLINKFGTTNINSLPEIQEKRKATNLLKYGTEIASQSEIVKEKAKQTFLEHFGVENPMFDSTVREKYDKERREFLNDSERVQHRNLKMKQTNLEKYGVENVFELPEFQELAIQRNIEKYGVDKPSKLKEFQIKARNTMIERYGVEHTSQLEENKAKRFQTYYQNGTQKASNQQRYLHKLIGGELNYPINHYSVDICFPDDKIYTEYNGSGHWLNIKFNTKTEEEHKIYERKRWYYLFRRDWKQIIFISRKDYLPSDETIIGLINYAKDFLKNSPRSNITFDIDEGIIKTSKYTIPYDYGKLRKIKKSDLPIQSA